MHGDPEGGRDGGAETKRKRTEAQGERGRNRQVRNWERKGEIVSGNGKWGDGVMKTEASGWDRRGERLC